MEGSKASRTSSILGFRSRKQLMSDELRHELGLESILIPKGRSTTVLTTLDASWRQPIYPISISSRAQRKTVCRATDASLR